MNPTAPHTSPLPENVIEALKVALCYAPQLNDLPAGHLKPLTERVVSALASVWPRPTESGREELRNESDMMKEMASALAEIEKQTRRVNEGKIDAHSQVGTIALFQCRQAHANYLKWRRKPKLPPDLLATAPQEPQPASQEGQTVETDANGFQLVEDQGILSMRSYRCGDWVKRDFARTLERQRDEARRQLTAQRDAQEKELSALRTKLKESLPALVSLREQTRRYLDERPVPMSEAYSNNPTVGELADSALAALRAIEEGNAK
jgi:hypothetical protein